jgi:DNA-binding response OmpR family regulator
VLHRDAISADQMRSSGHATSAPAPIQRLDLRGLVVLVVEDHDDSRDMLRQTVEAFGADVLQAREGRQALSLTADTVPDLVLLDLKMPGMDGFEFMERMRERKRLSHVPVVAVTALGTEADVMKTWETGFDGHLVKPVTFDVVEAQLGRVFPAQRQPQGE